MELIWANQYISAQNLAKTIGISDRAVEKQLAKLKGQGVIERIGPDGGYWRINI